jgi:hypothetical protein
MGNSELLFEKMHEFLQKLSDDKGILQDVLSLENNQVSKRCCN